MFFSLKFPTKDGKQGLKGGLRMKIHTKGALFYEMVKIKTAVTKKDTAGITQYYDDYLNELTASTSEIFHAGCFTLYSEKISYHLLATYLLLDLIDFHWDGKKFINDTIESKPNLLDILSAEIQGEFTKKQGLTEALYAMQKLTKHRLHVFLLPAQHKNSFSLEITYPGNVLILFPDEHNKVALLKGVAEFYYKKQLKEILPHWADSFDQYQMEFLKWANNEPSKFNARKMNES